MRFIVVENRTNETLSCCLRSAARAGVQVDTVASTTGGQAYEEFAARYKHLSTNSSSFELICFRRYFLLLEHARQKGLGEFVLIDSDVLLFPGVEQYLRCAAAGREFVGSLVNGASQRHKRISPHVSYWTLPALERFVSFLLKAYRDEAILTELEAIYLGAINEGKLGGVSDMTLLYLWCVSENNLGASTAAIIDGRTADHNITSEDNEFERQFISWLGVKRIRFLSQDRPYGRTKDGIDAAFVLLHFQGRAKMAMKLHLNGNHWRASALLHLLGVVKRTRASVLRVLRAV